MERTKGSMILVSIFGVLALCGISLGDDPTGKPAPLFCAVGWRGEFTLIRPGVGELPPKRYDLPTHLQALAWSPDGVLYAGREGDLYTLNHWTGDFEHAVSINSDIRGMAFAPSGELYVTSEYTLAQRLRIIDLETGAHREAGVLWGDGETAQGLAFSPGGVLYAISPKVHVGTYELFTIDLDDAKMHLLGSFSSSANANQSIAFAPDGCLYALGADVLVQLNPADGTIIGSPTRLSGEYRGLELVRGPKTVYYVDNDALGANNGSSWDDAFNYLQDALTAAEAYTEIRVAQGIYRPDLGAGITPADRTATFQMKNNVTIKGGYAGCGQPDPNARDTDLYETILSGDLAGDDVNDPADLPQEPTRAENSYTVVTGSGTDETAILDGFIIAGGNANGDWDWGFCPEAYGGGMFNNDGSPTLRACTFRGNSAHGGRSEEVGTGGAVYNVSSSPTFTGCTFTGNRALGFGGAMHNENSSPRLLNCTFNHNTAKQDGGGMRNHKSSPILINCTFSENESYYGAGMGNGFSNVTLINCTFTRNLASGKGGGMYNCQNTGLTLMKCTFVGNSSGEDGGGMDNHHTFPTLTNCSFIGNSAGQRGGGISSDNHWYSPVAPITLSNCTFSDNSAANGGAVACDSYRQQYPSDLRVTNCILWNGENSIWNNDGSTIALAYSDVRGGSLGEGNIDSDPCFAEPGYWDSNSTWVDGDYHLLPDSPCINAGDPNYIAEPNETDLAGRPRVIGSRIDMGAYEFNHVPVADAGPDETVYAGVDRMAKVTLDGTGSYDEDGQPLTYKWSLKTDGEIVPLPGDGIVNLRDFAALARKWRGLKKLLGETTLAYGHRQAVLADLSALSDLWLSTASSPKWNPEYDIAQTGPTPTIELPVGVHVIELVVNDGINDSLPDQVIITVVGPTEADLRVLPRKINPHSRMKNVLAIIRLPAEIAEDQIDISEPLLLYPGSIAASNQRVTHSHSQADVRTSIFALFDKAALMDAVTDDGPVELQVVGRLMTGQYYYGCDAVTVIHAP